MRLSAFIRHRQRVFSSCLTLSPPAAPRWSSVDHLAGSTHSSKADASPESILNMASKGLKFQIFDCSFWDRVHRDSLSSSHAFTPSQWVRLLHAYKRIKIRNRELFDLALSRLEGALDGLSLRELSLLSLSFSYFGFCAHLLFASIAQAVCRAHEKGKLKELEVSEDSVPRALGPSSPAEEPSSTSLQERALRSRRAQECVSYVHLLGSYAKCGLDNRPLFEAATEALVENLSRGADLAPNLIVKLLHSYSRYAQPAHVFRFGYRNVRLLELLGELLLTSRLSDEELEAVRTMLAQLQYSSAALDSVFAYRLGNSSARVK